MKKFASVVIILFFALVGIYFATAAVLMVVGTPAKPVETQTGMAFKELYVDYSNIPALQPYTTRDGKQLNYRYYPSKSDKILILLHGSSWHSRYFLPLAQYISSEGLAQVYTPDLRGHGPNPEKRGDVDYIGQLDDDLADLIAVIRKDHPQGMLIIGGHSSGGGLAVRFGGGKYGKQADAYLLLSPYLGYDSPTLRPDSGGWALPYTGRIIGLSMLNGFGIEWFNGLAVMDFNMPKEIRDGTETLSYTYRLNTSFGPRDYKTDLSAITQPLFVTAGTADEAFYAEKFEAVISQFTKVQVKVIPGMTHNGAVASVEVRPGIKEWLESLVKP